MKFASSLALNMWIGLGPKQVLSFRYTTGLYNKILQVLIGVEICLCRVLVRFVCMRKEIMI